MSVLKHLYLDDIITSFPELGPTVQDGGYSWIILIGVFLIQMTIPSILSVYGIVLGYLTENKTGEFDLWDQKIILTPMLFIAFWSLADPWSKMIVDLSSVPRIIGLIGIALISIGVLASGYLATGGVGAYLASLSAGAVMGIGASFVLIQSQECLQKYFRIKLSVAFTIRNIALSLGYIIVPSLTHFLLMQVHLKIALLLITIIFIPTILGVALLRQPMSPKPSRYNLLLTTEDDSEVSAKYLSNVNMGVESTENNNLENSSCERTEQIEDTNSSFAGNNEIYTYEDSEEDIFVNSTIKSNNKWKNQIQIFLYFRFWTIILTWVGIKSFTLFFWILLPYMFITKISSSQDYVTISIIAGFACWLGCSILVVLTYTTEYYVFMACALLGGICIGGLSVCQDSILCDIFGPRFIHQFHKVFSTVVGISLLSLCFVRNAILCFHLVALLLLLSGCYWIWLPILNIVKQRCIDHRKAMKMSFSLSSLQPSSNSLERRKQVSMPLERPYNSLTKKRKDPKQMQCQRMWTNREDSKDDFWAAIRSNYDYIMDTNLIDSCKEANGELTWDETDVSTQSWSLKEVSCQFSELYSWLRVLQELVYSKEENLLDKSLRAAHMEELRRRAYRRKLFNEQAEKLVACTPALKDEVAWRVNHLNAKWELVEQIMAPVERTVSDEQDVSADFEHEVRCLRKWLREMESRLKPLSFHVDWTLAELEEKAMEHMVSRVSFVLKITDHN
ncbi:hypothetical protein HZH66_003626 [Vespula vulgaris]|uniref:Uncharacterized protein n=1 Tax=Vespula vulgaris TaxID=7454 RepID=A0A834ND90_VESVU|nr:hypothetical protein HZH66_003626 [Vespula vulgaris]